MQSSFFSSRFVRVHVAHPYSSIDATAAWKKLCFILSVRSDFHIIDSLLIAIYIYIYIYIYIHTHTQSKVFSHLQKFSFLILNVLFLMKWVKHRNVFIYHTRYKSFWDTLNTNQTKKKLKKKTKKTLHSLKWPPLAAITASDSQHSFHSRLEVDWRYFCLAFLQELPEVNALVGYLALIFQLSSSHTSSMGFKSTDCTSQDISWRICCSSLLLAYIWQSLLVCFGPLPCMSTNPWSTSRVPDGITWYCCMLW